jgi:hypothetical protein
LIVQLPGTETPPVGEHIRAVARLQKLHLLGADGRRRIEI